MAKGKVRFYDGDVLERNGEHYIKSVHKIMKIYGNIFNDFENCIFRRKTSARTQRYTTNAVTVLFLQKTGNIQHYVGNANTAGTAGSVNANGHGR